MADQKDILERVSELPDDLRKALFARTTTDTIQSIGKNAGLPIDKIGELADETGRVMLGFTPPSDYVKNLVSRLGAPQEKARAIAEEINQKVFQPVRESLKKIHGISGPVASASAQSTEAPGGPKIITPVSTIKQLPSPKPHLKREDIAAPPKPLPAPEISELLSIPPIFVKKIPEPIVSKPDIIPPPKESVPQNSLAAKTALDKELNTPIPKQRPQYDKDPYR